MLRVIPNDFKNIYEKDNYVSISHDVGWVASDLARRRTPALGINFKVIRIGCIVFPLAPMGVIPGSLNDNIRIRNVQMHAQIEDALREHFSAVI